MMSEGAENPIGYAGAADSYWAAGWRGVLPLPYGGKKYPPSIKCDAAREAKRKHQIHRGDLCPDCVSYTGHSAIEPSYPDIMAWSEEFRDGNLALHMLNTEKFAIVGIDVDNYGAKKGAAAFAEAIRRWGPLPESPRSTSRENDPIGGIRLFRVPPGTVLEQGISFPELGIGDIEICQRHHRYVVAWPSVHPEGRQYWWRNDADQLIGIPERESLPWLPQRWIDALKLTPRSASITGVAYNVAEALTAGEPSFKVRERMQQAIKEMNLPGSSRHDTAMRHVMAILRMGKSGEPGVGDAIKLLGNIFVTAVTIDGSREPGEARAEFERLVTNDNAARELAQPGLNDWLKAMVGEDFSEKEAAPPAQTSERTRAPGGAALEDSRPVSPLEGIERGFWESRESLAAIKQGALSRMAPPWGTLAHCAARALSMIPPHVVLPPVIGGPGSLNWFVATVARASGGKGASAAAANILVPRSGFLHRKIGSGEGIIAAFGRSGGDDSPPEHECIMFTTNEIDSLAAMATRTSSTTLPILREGFFGEDLGFAYSAKDKRRLIPEHTYRMTLVIAAQPKKMGWLLADTDGGTPQRFMWFPAADSRISRKDRPWEPGELELPKPGEWMYPRTISIPPEATELIEVEQEKRSRDEGDAADGHALFCREKFAFALAVLDGRVEMNSEDWELSGIAADISTYTRELSRDAVKEGARIEAVDRGDIRGVELAAADESKQYEEAERVRRSLRWALAKIEAAGEEGISHRELANAADSRSRRWLASAVEVGRSNGLIRQIEGTTTWVKI